MLEKTPCVSVVVPVYNAEPYVDECLDSLRGQTFADLEIICVDDGSTDGSLARLRAHEAADPRVRVLTQPNAGVSAARNAGLAQVRGEFVFFMDADDFCDPAFLQKTVAAATAHNADAVVTAFAIYSQITHDSMRPAWDCDYVHYPIDQAFSWRDHPDHLFQAFHNYTWNKLVRTSFLRRHGIAFPPVRLTEDLMFSAHVKFLAERQAYRNETLVFHRDGTGTNSMSSKHLHPFDFITAFRDLRVFLQEQGVYGELRRAYVNWAGPSCRYNLMTIDDAPAFFAVFDALKEAGLAELDLVDVPAELWNDPEAAAFVQRVLTNSREEFLHHYYMEATDWRRAPAPAPAPAPPPETAIVRLARKAEKTGFYRALQRALELARTLRSDTRA